MEKRSKKRMIEFLFHESIPIYHNVIIVLLVPVVQSIVSMIVVSQDLLSLIVYLTLSHSERQKLHTMLAIGSAYNFGLSGCIRNHIQFWPFRVQ